MNAYFIVRFCYFAPSRLDCGELVCLPVFDCLSVCLFAHIMSKIRWLRLTKFSVNVDCGRGSVVLWRRCDTLCIYFHVCGRRWVGRSENEPKHGEVSVESTFRPRDAVQSHCHRAFVVHDGSHFNRVLVVFVSVTFIAHLSSRRLSCCVMRCANDCVFK